MKYIPCVMSVKEGLKAGVIRYESIERAERASRDMYDYLDGEGLIEGAYYIEVRD